MVTMPDNENPILKSNTTVSDFHKSINQTKRRHFIQLAKINHSDYSKLLYDDSDEEQPGHNLELPQTGRQLTLDEDIEQIDSNEIFDLIRSITDPEHPLTLEDLSVVSSEQISVTYPDEPDSNPHIMLRFTPTIPHCSMATLIGLTLRVQLLRSLPERFKVDIKIKEGTHQSENSVNKQLNDKERVAAALENNHLLGVVEQCLKTAHLRGRKETPLE